MAVLRQVHTGGAVAVGDNHSLAADTAARVVVSWMPRPQDNPHQLRLLDISLLLRLKCWWIRGLVLMSLLPTMDWRETSFAKHWSTGSGSDA